MPSTYQELKDTILAFSNSPVIEQSIDTFIDLCEADMSRRIRHWQMERRATGSVSVQYVPLPNDFVEPIRLSITSGDTYRLELISQSEMMQRRERTNDTSGRPKYFVFTDGQIEVFPTPDATYTVEIVYYSKIPALSSSASTNWLLTNYPDVYLYGSLSHCAPFLGEDSRMQVWSALHEKAINGVNADNEKSKYGGTGLRMKIRSY